MPRPTNKILFPHSAKGIIRKNPRRHSFKTGIGENAKLENSEIENSIVMDGAQINCGKRMIDSVIRRNATITDSNTNLPMGHKLILGDMTHVSI